MVNKLSGLQYNLLFAVILCRRKRFPLTRKEGRDDSFLRVLFIYLKARHHQSATHSGHRADLDFVGQIIAFACSGCD